MMMTVVIITLYLYHFVISVNFCACMSLHVTFQFVNINVMCVNNSALQETLANPPPTNNQRATNHQLSCNRPPTAEPPRTNHQPSNNPPQPNFRGMSLPRCHSLMGAQGHVIAPVSQPNGRAKKVHVIIVYYLHVLLGNLTLLYLLTCN